MHRPEFASFCAVYISLQEAGSVMHPSCSWKKNKTEDEEIKGFILINTLN